MDLLSLFPPQNNKTLFKSSGNVALNSSILLKINIWLTPLGVTSLALVLIITMKTDFPTERKVCHGVGITCTDEQEDRSVCHGKQDPQSAMTGHHMSVVLTFK